MTRFYFDVFDGEQVLADTFGDEFRSEKEAADQAAGLLPEFIRDHLVKQHNMHAAISVRNDWGEVIYRSVAVIRSQWPDRDRDDFHALIDKNCRILSESRKLRAEAQSLSERLRVNVLQLLSVMENAAANVEVSRKILRGGGA